MKNYKFLIYFIIVFGGIIIIDIVIRAKYSFVSYNEPANIIILGASRANHHYRTIQIEDSLGMSAFNYGWDGRCILYQYLCLLRGIENGELKTVILDISEAQLSNEWVNDRISDLYPYYWKNDTIKDMVDKVEKKSTNYFLLSSLVQFNSQFSILFSHENNIKGYAPLQYTGKPVIIVPESRNEGIGELNNKDFYSNIALEYFEMIVKICRERKINLYVCLSPSLSVTKIHENYLENLCKKYDVICWNKTHYITDPLMFSDLSHLNDEGSKIYTAEIIRLIKTYNKYERD